MKTKIAGLLIGVGLGLTLAVQVSAMTIAEPPIGPAPEPEAPYFEGDQSKDVTDAPVAGEPQEAPAEQASNSTGCDNGECERNMVGEAVHIPQDDDLPIDYSMPQVTMSAADPVAIPTLAAVPATIPDFDQISANGKLPCGMGIVFHNGAQIDNSCK